MCRSAIRSKAAASALVRTLRSTLNSGYALRARIPQMTACPCFQDLAAAFRLSVFCQIALTTEQVCSSDARKWVVRVGIKGCDNDSIGFSLCVWNESKPQAVTDEVGRTPVTLG